MTGQSVRRTLLNSGGPVFLAPEVTVPLIPISDLNWGLSARAAAAICCWACCRICILGSIICQLAKWPFATCQLLLLGRKNWLQGC